MMGMIRVPSEIRSVRMCCAKTSWGLHFWFSRSECLGLGCTGSDGAFGVGLWVAWLSVVHSTHEAFCIIEDTSVALL